MSDDDKPFGDLGDLDWDSALDDWEKNTFVPEVAHDAETNKAASEPASQAKPPAAPNAPSPPGSLRDLSAEGTVIAPVPRELRDDPSSVSRSQPPPPVSPVPSPLPGAVSGRLPSVPPPARSQRGGLGQLWAKRDSLVPPAPPPPRPPAAHPPSERTIAAHPSTDDLARAAGAASSGTSSVTRQVVAPSFDLPVHDDGASSTADLDAPTAPRVSPRGDAELDTMIGDREKLESMSDAETANRLPSPDALAEERAAVQDDDDEPTRMRSSSSLLPAAPSSLGPHTERERPPAPEGPSTFEGERPASRWLDEKTAASYRQRAAWLEEEARAVGEPAEQSRALLVVSELYAIAGDDERALALATEARDMAPELPLAWRQARQLLGPDTEAMVAALDAEAASSPSPASRAHATLLAADLLRINDNGDAAVSRWRSASKLDPADVRAHAARAALALAQNDHTGALGDLAENSELATLGRAVATALRLRGVERPGAEVVAAPINDGLRHARLALDASDVAGAAQALAAMGREGSLAKGALWLSSAFGATHIAARRGSAKALKTLVAGGDPLARRQLAARGIELGDPELVTAALDGDAGAFDPVERAALLALASQDTSEAVSDIALSAPLASLVDALTAITPDTDASKRPERTSGSAEARALTGLGRLLATKPAVEAIDEALAAVPTPRAASAAGVALEASVRAKRWDDLSAALSELPASDDPNEAVQRHIAAALVAERAGNQANAKRAWREALASHGHETLLRIVAKLDDEVDHAAELLRVADEMPDGVPSAILRLEALARAELGDDEQAAVLERVHRAAPSLGIGAFLAERIGRRRGDLEEVLRWIQERRSYATDPIETALDAVREALLVADRDPELASTRLDEAHRARPDDVALRELFERLSTDPPADRAAWRQARAEKASGPTRAALFTEAALEHERSGDAPAALRAAREALEAGDKGLAHLVADRAEIETGEITRQAGAMLTRAKEADDDVVRREAYERLAELEAYGKKDTAAALQWHQAVLEEFPRHKPSLRWVEQTLVSAGSDAELERIAEQIAIALDGVGGGEVTGHAQVAARLRQRAEGDWERTANLARLAAMQPEPSLWSLRALNAHARLQKDDAAILKTTIALLERTQRPSERAALLLRASEAAARIEHVADARAFLEQAASEDPGDVVTWGFLAEVRERGGETRAAAEACESLARTSAVPEHQLLAWDDAARIWVDEVKEPERAMSALEQAAEIDVTYGDVFHRLSQLYAEKRLDAELARLLEKRLERAEDAEERVTLEVELARALGEMGELAKAKSALENALQQRPDHTTALGALADLCAKEGDWQGAEQSFVRLARLATTPEDQRAIYEKLGEIYAVHLGNLSRAEVSYKEVLKRAPKDLGVLAKLVDVYKRQGDVGRAVETQQQIVAEATDPALRLQRLVELASIYESARDLRKAEQALEAARKEFPTSVGALRALAEFYRRHSQMPAMQILLDRAASDARRSFAAGRFVTSLFEVLHAAYDLRGKKDSARVVAATLAAVEGHTAELVGAEARAVDPRLDDVLAPDLVSPAIRALLTSAGDALDAAAPMDLRALRAAPLVPGSPIGATVGAVATVVGLGALQILVAPELGRVAIPIGSNPPTLLVGEELATAPNERARTFVVVRALKMILARSSALLRGAPEDVAVLVEALFTVFNPSFVPQGVDKKRVAETARRIHPALPKNLDPTVGVIALEAAGTLAMQAGALGAATAGWANRVALLAIGDPGAALDAIAWSKGEDAAPTGSEERAAWIARTAEARELMTFSVTDAYSEARTRLGLDR
jgi:tetratricopeptide (TPR) repeat protein